MASNIYLKRKTRKLPFMFPRRKVVHSISSVDSVDILTLSGDCVHCVSEPICKFS